MHSFTPTIIHLGLPKTATTTLQAHLFAHHSQVHYFGKYEGGGFHPAVRSVLVPKLYHLVNFDPNNINLTEIKKEITHAEKNSLKTILSREGLSGGSRQKKQKEASLFKMNFGPCKAIIFLRKPEDFIKSYYVQMLKGFHKRKLLPRPDWMNALGQPPKYFDINEWLALAWNTPPSPRQTLCYADTVEIYAKTFGQDNIHIFIFEEFIKNPKKVICDLCETIGIDAEEGFRLIDGKQTNERITTGYIDRIKTIQKSRAQTFMFRKAAPEKRLQMITPNKNFGKKIEPEISKEWLEKIHTLADKQNNRIVRNWGIPLSDYGYRL